ncbi:hypothetical protein [Bradyrhizobium cenepequi]|nr:hypothetical protein [Bradyrhizobium cenepequi]
MNQVARLRSLAIERCSVLRGKTDLQGAAMPLDRVEDGVGVEALH